ncbi:MAG: phosphoadenosine phosphosulfate reductase family protein [Saprospiraceae bacterium]|nr:phosphoadenosine phosphosulfate reductase family protein [Saprospiraceae bacterium]
MKRIINFSGGKSSALMTILEYNPETDYVVFCDTGREHDKTYKFINDFEAFENIPIIRLGGKDSFTKYLAKRDFEEIPNMMKRSCTIELKVKVARRWARKNIGMSYDSLLGFRFDEPQRVVKNKKRWQQVNNVFPLFDKKINKAYVNDYWLNKPYTLEIPSILGNCTLCFMKGKSKIISILRVYPELANEWIEDERLSSLKYGYTYLKDMSIEQCLKISQTPDLFTSINLEYLSPAFDCSCSS